MPSNNTRNTRRLSVDHALEAVPHRCTPRTLAKLLVEYNILHLLSNDVLFKPPLVETEGTGTSDDLYSNIGMSC